MVKKYAKYYFLAFAVFLAIFLSARPWQWLVSSADEQSFRTLRIEKVWDDDGNVDGIRPESVKMKVFQNETLWREVTVTKEDGWKLSITDAPVADEEGEPYDYTIEEEVPGGYTASVARSMQDKYPVLWRNGVDGSEIKSMDLNTLEGIDGLYPEAPAVDGYEFKAWSSPVLTDGIYVITAEYEEDMSTEYTVRVNFVDQSDAVIKTSSMAVPKNEPYDATPLIEDKPDNVMLSNDFSGDETTGIADSNKTIIVPVYDPIVLGYNVKLTYANRGSYGFKVILTNTSDVTLYGFRVLNGIVFQDAAGNERSDITYSMINFNKPWTIKDPTKQPQEIVLLDRNEPLAPGASVEYNYLVKTPAGFTPSTYSWSITWFSDYTPSAAAASVFSMPEAAAARFAVLAADPQTASAVYDSGIDFTVTNLHEPVERMRFDVMAEWDDGDDVDGARPEEAYIYLLKNGDYFDVVTLYDVMYWSTNVTDLMKYDPVTGEI